MSPLRLACRGATLACVVALVACRASVPAASGPGGGSLARPPSGFVVARYADSLPITALAVRKPWVWAGTARGLRRWNVGVDIKTGDGGAEGDAETMGAETGLPGHGVSALGIDDGGGVWVATEAGIGRLESIAGPAAAKGVKAGASRGPHLGYQAHGTLAGISLLVPSRGDGGVWAGGVGGLFRFDGRAWTPVEFLRDVAVTSLELDADGRAAWVGTRGRGLFLVDEKGGRPILASGAGGAGDEIVGTSPSEGGARVVAVRADDGGRIIFITKDGPDEYRTQPGAATRFVRLVAAGGNPVLVAGAPGAERLFALHPLPRGESPAAGGFRLVSTHKGSTARYAATPLAIAAPPEITVAAADAAAVVAAGVPAIWFGSRTMGVARAEAPRPRYLSGDLTEDTDRLSVVCAAVDRCLLVAGGAHAWSFDGAGFRELHVGETAQGRALAVVADGTGAIFSVTAEPPWKSLALNRLAAGAGDKGADWQPVEKVPLDLGGSRPSVSFAAFSPAGNLWLGLGAVAEMTDGQEQGRGALEIAPASHRVVRHGAVEKSATNPESLPLPHDLTGVVFDGSAIWFSSRSGVNRWQESELRHWGENEHMDSEVCYGVSKGSDGKIWAATAAGVGRFDGTEWRFGGGVGQGDAGHVAAAAHSAMVRGVVNDGAGHMWLGTAKGLRVLDASAAGAPRLASGQLIVDDEMLAVTLDRLGRVWALGAAALAIVDPGRN